MSRIKNKIQRYHKADEINPQERITAWLNPEADEYFIKKVIEDLIRAGADPYLTKRHNKVAICRRGWVPTDY